MATSMRESPLDGGHREKVADPSSSHSKTVSAAANSSGAANFEYDDNEWDIGIGNLIIDLDADIEKTNDKAATSTGGANNNTTTNNNNVAMASTPSSIAQATTPSSKAKVAGSSPVEHSATVDKGLKMKIKRTKPGTKEAKHEIVKPPGDGSQVPQGAGGVASQNGDDKSNSGVKQAPSVAVVGGGGVSKRGSSSGHRRDKKHTDKPGAKPEVNGVMPPSPGVSPVIPVSASAVVAPVTPLVVAVAPSAPVTSVVSPSVVPSNPPVAPHLTPAVLQQPPTAASDLPPANVPPAPSVPVKQETVEEIVTPLSGGTTSPPPAKKLKPTPAPAVAATVAPPMTNGVDSKMDVTDVCVGTSVGTITEPDCLGPCEPGTSVTLEGIVWHETEGGVLVVNVTWRGKTYVGTLLDCTKHDWAPPRFCDSPTSDLDARTPKGRGKRGRAAAAAPANDLSNFTETRSSVHSKLRNGAKGRRGAAGSPAPPTVPAFATPRPETTVKRKGRASETEDSPVPVANGKRSRSGSRGPPASPPASPVLLECPEPNCSKKYKHINGLKYHQSHAHGAGEEMDSKDATSLSDNDESNAEPPSVPPSPSPEKGSPAPKLESKDDAPMEGDKPIVKPGVLRFGPEEPSSFPVGVFCNKPVINIPTPPCSKPTITTPGDAQDKYKVKVCAARSLTAAPALLPDLQEKRSTLLPDLQEKRNTLMPDLQEKRSTLLPDLQEKRSTLLPDLQEKRSTLLPDLQDKRNTLMPDLQEKRNILMPDLQDKRSALLPDLQEKRNTLLPDLHEKRSTLMPDLQDKEKKQATQVASPGKKKARKSPASSPQPDMQHMFLDMGAASEGREDVQSPAYSDISDDAAPLLDTEDKSVSKSDKKPEPVHYGMYPFYGQPPYLVPSVVGEKPPKEGEKREEVKEKEKEKKEVPVSTPNPTDFQQKILQQPQQPHYYPPYGYVPGYPYNIEGGYPLSVMSDKYMDEGKEGKQEKVKEIKEEKAEIKAVHSKDARAPVKLEAGVKNENHQILKESIEMKSQMNDKSKFFESSPYMYQRQVEELRNRYYLPYPETQRRKEAQPLDATVSKDKSKTLPSPKPHKEKQDTEKLVEKKEEKKQEGVKPTMETQGPPPPTSSYAYIHPGYMQSPHYGPLPFDPNHPMYRSMNPMMVPAGYGASPYLHPQMRYHGPEDLSRGPPAAPTKALDMLQHHANQYYSSHKIHELQERALKSPTPKSNIPSQASSQPPATLPPSSVQQQPPQATPPSLPVSGASVSPAVTPAGPPGKDGKDAPAQIRSPPPQRHVHTHHHTHVGLGYPLLPGQYPAPYGAAAVLATQQAAASVVDQFPAAASK